MIPADYRQLSKAQILTRWLGLNETLCYVELVRLLEPEPQTVFADEAKLSLQWSDYALGGRRPRKLKAHEPRTLVLASVQGIAWAEYSLEHNLEQDGTWVCEDYLMRLYAPDGSGPTQVERTRAVQAQVEDLIHAVVKTSADRGATAIKLGDTLLTTPPTAAGYVAQAERIAQEALAAHRAIGYDAVQWESTRQAACSRLQAICAQLQAAVEVTSTVEGQLEGYRTLSTVQNLLHLILSLPVQAGRDV